MLLYYVLCFNSKVNSQCFKMVHCKIMTGGTHSKMKRFKRYMMFHLANVVKEAKKTSPGLSHSLRIYSLGACRTHISLKGFKENIFKIGISSILFKTYQMRRTSSILRIWFTHIIKSHITKTCKVSNTHPS